MRHAHGTLVTTLLWSGLPIGRKKDFLDRIYTILFIPPNSFFVVRRWRDSITS